MVRTPGRTEDHVGPWGPGPWIGESRGTTRDVARARGRRSEGWRRDTTNYRGPGKQTRAPGTVLIGASLISLGGRRKCSHGARRPVRSTWLRPCHTPAADNGRAAISIRVSGWVGGNYTLQVPLPGPTNESRHNTCTLAPPRPIDDCVRARSLTREVTITRSPLSHPRKCYNFVITVAARCKERINH